MLQIQSGKLTRDDQKRIKVRQSKESKQEEGNERPSLLDQLKVGVNEDLDPIPLPLLRKYIAYARHYVQPKYVEPR